MIGMTHVHILLYEFFVIVYYDIVLLIVTSN